MIWPVIKLFGGPHHGDEVERLGTNLDSQLFGHARVGFIIHTAESTFIELYRIDGFGRASFEGFDKRTNKEREAARTREPQLLTQSHIILNLGAPRSDQSPQLTVRAPDHGINR